MNIYTVNFSAKCPRNGLGIKYTLEVHTGAVLMAEDLRAHVDAIGEGLHEDIADALLAKFGGSQRLEAEHHGVHIKTIRPHLAHWQKPEKQPAGAMTREGSGTSLEFTTLGDLPQTPEQERAKRLAEAQEDREWADYAAGILNG